MQQQTASIPIRLPIAMGITLSISIAIMCFYLITLGLVFAYQQEILIITGINPAQMSIVVLMLILFIPWGVIAWLLLRRFSKKGILRLYASHLAIMGTDNLTIKEYQAKSILLITVQNNAYHFDFDDGFKFNIINLVMGGSYSNQMIAFRPYLLKFIEENDIQVKQGRIV